MLRKIYFFCPACNEAFNLSAALDQEEAAAAEGIINNPPAGIKVKKSFDELAVGIYTRAPVSLFLIPFTAVFGGTSSFVLFTLLRDGIFDGGLDAGNIIFTSIMLLFPLASLFLGLMTLYSIFGKVELVVGKSAYIFQGIGNIGIKKYIDWKSIKEISLHTDTSSEGSVSKSIYITENKLIKISTKFLSETKTGFLLSLLKYFWHEITAGHKKQKIID